MINALKRYQNFIIIALVIIAGVVAYSIFFTKEDTSPLVVSGPVTTPVEQDLIQLLGDLKAITLDTSIFISPAFQSLADFGQDLITEPVGRTNPFAPFE